MIEIVGVGSVQRGGSRITMPELAIAGTGLVRVLGPNGSGKSTLIELLAGTIALPAGTVRICGEHARSAAARRLRRVCRAESALIGHVTLRRHAALFARASHLSLSAATAALSDEGLEERLDDTVDELSTGEARRAWVRLTTLGAAPVLLLDEPFLGLDTESAAALRARIVRWTADRLVVLVDHEEREWDRAVEIDLVPRSAPR